MSGELTLQEGLQRVVSDDPLGRGEVQHLFERVLDGDADPAVLGAFLAALAQGGERAEEVAGVAAALRARMTPFEHGLPDAVDTCGTGGDGLGMVNVSTAAAFVAAGAVDALWWFRAPILLGAEGRPCVAALALANLADAPKFRRLDVQSVGDDLWERYEALR